MVHLTSSNFLVLLVNIIVMAAGHHVQSSDPELTTALHASPPDGPEGAGQPIRHHTAVSARVSHFAVSSRMDDESAFFQGEVMPDKSNKGTFDVNGASANKCLQTAVMDIPIGSNIYLDLMTATIQNAVQSALVGTLKETKGNVRANIAASVQKNMKTQAAPGPKGRKMMANFHDNPEADSDVVGSIPPFCQDHCGQCSPCVPANIPVGRIKPTDEYYPEVWRCQCNGEFYP